MVLFHTGVYWRVVDVWNIITWWYPSQLARTHYCSVCLRRSVLHTVSGSSWFHARGLILDAAIKVTAVLSSDSIFMSFYIYTLLLVKKNFLVLDEYHELKMFTKDNFYTDNSSPTFAITVQFCSTFCAESISVWIILHVQFLRILYYMIFLC